MEARSEQQAYGRAILRGLDWLTSLLNPDGSYPTSALAAHYKSPLLFAETARSTEGERTLNWIIDRYMTQDGHFKDVQTDATPSRYCDLYEDLWIAWGAARLGRSDVSRRTFEFCSRFYVQEHGGFRSVIESELPKESMLYDLRSTALAGLVALVMGELDVAITAARFTMTLLDLQPNQLEEFFLVRDGNGALITSYPSDLAWVFVIPRRPSASRAPLYYALGLGMVFLARLYEATDNANYLTSAERYAAVCRHYGEGILRNHYSGKLGWALQLLYRLTGERDYARMAAIASAYLLETQLPTGAWSVPTLFAQAIDQPLAFTIDRTAEYSLWMKYIESERSALPNR